MSSCIIQACKPKGHGLCNTRDFGQNVCHRAHTHVTTRAIVSANLRNGLLGPLTLSLGLQAKHPRGCGITRNPGDRTYQPGKERGRSLWGRGENAGWRLVLQFLGGPVQPWAMVQPRPTTITARSLFQTLLARALYDNLPDCSDELAFSRGDILTIVEQSVPESEGWWKCLLHGRQGLAPANRLQVLRETPADRPCPLLLRGLDADPTSSEAPYQVHDLFSRPPPGPVYEPMRSWVEGPSPATAQVYVLPDSSPSSARVICEKTLSFPKQVSVSPDESTGRGAGMPRSFSTLQSSPFVRSNVQNGTPGPY